MFDAIVDELRAENVTIDISIDQQTAKGVKISTDVHGRMHTNTYEHTKTDRHTDTDTQTQTHASAFDVHFGIL